MKVRLLISFIVLYSIQFSSCVNLQLKELFQPENAGILEIMKKELESFQVEMTKSFMEAHSRRKRALSGVTVTDLTVLPNRFVEIVGESVGPFSTFTFDGTAYIIKRGGIYKINGLVPASVPAKEVISAKPPQLAGEWSLSNDEMVLNGYEWEQNFFLLTSNSNFSSIYTMHEDNLTPIFRQRIFNKGNAVAGQFFEQKNNLYLVLCNDNAIHSTTFSAIFRFVGSYMDEIHQVQTTGATAVETFTIKSKTYIAIAQSQDATGNMELGTLVLSMDPMDRLERVQLLWSHGPRDLHYMSTDKEHFLVIAQEKEPAIVYWFGGMDFILWQQFDGLQGKDLFLNGFQLNTDEPILIASDGGHLRFFTRSSSAATKLLTTWVQSKTFDSRDSTEISSEERIVNAKFLEVRNGDEINGYLAITNKLLPGSNLESTKIFTLNIMNKKIAVSRRKDPGDSLAQCLQTLEQSLKDAQPYLNRIQEEGPKVLRTDKDFHFDGELESNGVVKKDPSESNVKRAQIIPEFAARAGSSDKLKTAPAKLRSDIMDDNDRLEKIKSTLDGIVYKSKKTEITGNLTFPGIVELGNLKSKGDTDLKVKTINGINWEDLKTSVLKRKASKPQQVNGEWTLDSLTAPEILIVDDNSKVSPNNFILKSCPNNQSIGGIHRFTGNLSLPQGINLGSAVTINNVKYSDLVRKEDENKEIRGYKHAPFVKGDFTPQKVNNVDLLNWFSSVARISNSSNTQQFTGPLTFAPETVVKVDQLNVEQLNTIDWDNFKSTVMLDGESQEIAGRVSFDVLRTEQLEASSINGIKSKSLLTSSSAQNISSLFSVENLHIKGPLSTRLINGIQLSNGVNRNLDGAEIHGPVVLQNLHVQDILVPDGIEIAGKDVSELAKLKKLHVYSTTDNSPIILRGVKADKLNANVINGKRLDELDTKYWSKVKNNVVNASQLVLSSRAVSILNDNFQTRTLNEFKFPDEFVSLDQSEFILKTPLRFEKPVVFNKEVIMGDGVTIENMDMSKVQSMIVDETFNGTVRGKKTFVQPAASENGADFGELNGMHPKRDVVLLNFDKVQAINGILKFEDHVDTSLLTVRKGDVKVDGLTNELNLEEIKQTTAYTDQDNVIEGHVVFEKGINATKFWSIQLNNVSSGEITSNLIFLNHPEEQFMEGGIEVEAANVSFFGESLVGDINNVPVHNYLANVVRLDSPNGLIVGTKRFTDVLLNGQFRCTFINGVDMMELESTALSKSKDQVISGKWSLENVKMTENLETSEIGGISFNNLVFINEPFEVTSPVTFNSSDVGIKGPVMVDGLVNGILLDERLKEFMTLPGENFFKDVSVNGDMKWTDDRIELNRLSYLFTNAVQKTGAQKILGKVHFLKGLKSSKLHSQEEWLAGVNLQKIKDDALTRDDISWELSGNNKYSKPLRIENLVKPVTTLDAEKVNGINLMEMNEDVYKVTDGPGRVFEGSKIFNGEMLIENFEIHDKFLDLNATDFVIKNDPREISQVHFKDLSIAEDVEWDPTLSSTGMDLASLLTDRVSLTKPHQELEGSFTLPSVTVENNCKVSTINDVNVKNTINRAILELPPITGKKIFSQSLTLDGEVETSSLNNHSVQELLDQTLRLDRKEVITRPVIFEKSVVVNQPVELETVNDLNMKTFHSDVSDRLERLVSEAKNPENIEMELNSWESHLQRMTGERPVWLEYLRLKQDLTELGPKTKVDHIKRNEMGDILVTFHHSSEDVEKVGLPKGCSCNKVNTLQIQEEGNLDGAMVPQSFGVDDCLQVYHVASETGTAYTVTSETFSTNATCISEMDKTTKIFVGKELLGEMKMGHVSDVGVFSDEQTDYLILAQYFDTETKSHSTTTRIMRVGLNGILETVQEIETHGAKKVALGRVSGRWMLAIANSKNNLDETSCNADSVIYVWSPMDNEFLLLRSVMTDGVFDVQFITTQPGNEFYRQSFVAFAQEGNAANGEVIILRYEQLGGNFALTQTIRSRWPITALGKTCLCRKCYLTTAVPQEGVTFYENRFVEGFREYYKAPVFGATDITSFKMNDEYLFAISTKKGPILAEAVIAGGSC